MSHLVTEIAQASTWEVVVPEWDAAVANAIADIALRSQFPTHGRPS
jgi:hypothetical protein